MPYKMAEKAVYLHVCRYTSEYIVQLCQINHIDINEVKTKQERIECLCELPHMKEPTEYQSQRQSDVHVHVLQLLENQQFRESAVPDFHKLSTDDDITCYLATFERMATAKKELKEEWPRLLEPYLTGKAQQAFHSLTESDKKYLTKIRVIILRRYQLTPEAYRLKFKTSSKKPDETFEEFATRLELYVKKFTFPSEESKASSDITRVLELVMTDQFLSTIHVADDGLWLKLREIKFPTTQATAKFADELILNRKTVYNANTNKPQQFIHTKSQSFSSRPIRPEHKFDRSEYPRTDVPADKPTYTKERISSRSTGKFDSVCYRCHEMGHQIADCLYPPVQRSQWKQHQSKMDPKPYVPKSAETSAKSAETAKAHVNFLIMPSLNDSTDFEHKSSGPNIASRVGDREVTALPSSFADGTPWGDELITTGKSADYNWSCWYWNPTWPRFCEGQPRNGLSHKLILVRRWFQWTPHQVALIGFTKIWALQSRGKFWTQTLWRWLAT